MVNIILYNSVETTSGILGTEENIENCSTRHCAAKLSSILNFTALQRFSYHNYCAHTLSALCHSAALSWSPLYCWLKLISLQPYFKVPSFIQSKSVWSIILRQTRWPTLALYWLQNLPHFLQNSCLFWAWLLEGLYDAPDIFLNLLWRATSDLKHNTDLSGSKAGQQIDLIGNWGRS